MAEQFKYFEVRRVVVLPSGASKRAGDFVTVEDFAPPQPDPEADNPDVIEGAEAIIKRIIKPYINEGVLRVPTQEEIEAAIENRSLIVAVPPKQANASTTAEAAAGVKAQGQPVAGEKPKA